MNSNRPLSGAISRTGVALLASVFLLLCAAVVPPAMAATATAAPSGGAALTRSAAVTAPSRALVADRPAGFWYGTDSWPVTIGGKAPYSEPAIGGSYGGYIGMAGNWAWWEGCHGQIAWSPTNSAQANTNYTTYHLGIGTGVYWFLGGPGVDSKYNGTTTEAYAFGANQARKTLYELGNMHITLKYPVIFEDVELPGIAPAPDNGWNSVYTSPCSGVTKASYIAPALDRAVFDGYAAYITSHSTYKVGVYSSPAVWGAIFGTGTAARIMNTYEWTYAADTSSLARIPDGWCLTGTSTCAQFFGGITTSSPYALMWQWSGGGGTYNGYGDFDQIDANRTP